jgi:hypothetical protein
MVDVVGVVVVVVGVAVLVVLVAEVVVFVVLVADVVVVLVVVLLVGELVEPADDATVKDAVTTVAAPTAKSTFTVTLWLPTDKPDRSNILATPPGPVVAKS